MGGVPTIPVAGDATGGRFTVVDVTTRRGYEPPPHVHDWQHEYIYVVEGSVEFHCGADDRFIAGAGDHVFIPHGVPHALVILTPTLRVIGVICSVDERAVGLDRFFLGMSGPATALEPSAEAATYATSDPAHAVRLGAAHGLRFLAPEEARELLPGYAGFGADRQ